MDINLTLNVDEVNAVLHTLGNLPTSSGAWPLVVKIKQQAEAQIPEEQAQSGEEAQG
jgi:hypothetical protein